MRISDGSSDVCSSDLPSSSPPGRPDWPARGYRPSLAGRPSQRRTVEPTAPRTRAPSAKRAEAAHIVSLAHEYDRDQAWSASQVPPAGRTRALPAKRAEPTHHVSLAHECRGGQPASDGLRGGQVVVAGGAAHDGSAATGRASGRERGGTVGEV